MRNPAEHLSLVVAQLFVFSSIQMEYLFEYQQLDARDLKA